MKVAFGVSWDDSKKKLFVPLTGILLLLTALPMPASQTQVSGSMVSVIVRELPNAGDAAESLVESLGGEVGRQIGLINGFSADIPVSGIESLIGSRFVHSVTPNRPVKLLSQSTDSDIHKMDGSMYEVAKRIGAHHAWKDGYTGQGVDVALIDSGVVPVEGLAEPGKLTFGPDVSLEYAAQNLRHLDTYGHGTHMAGIIAGKDTGAEVSEHNKDDFLGIAPEAGLVSIKVANAAGATDVSQVLAAIDWVVEHRNDNGMNIRVLNLAFGTDGTQDYRVDPLTFAVEQAWRHGIVVVVAAGNAGDGSAALNNPAYDPFVIAVAASDSKGKETPAWSSLGNGVRNPDITAPGQSVVSLRNPGSHIDMVHSSTGLVGERFFKGSGTSQAAAVTAGAAAVLLSQRPGLTPDQVKALLVETADKMKQGDPIAQGAGMIDLRDATRAGTPNAVQTFAPATGTGSLELARGTLHITDPSGTPLTGEQDIFGNPFNGVGWSTDSFNGVGWSGVGWSGVGWSGVGWSGVGWSGVGWSGVGWSSDVWNGVGWSGVGWSGVGWSGVGWSGVGWSGVGWSGVGWSGVGWSGVGWSGVGWSGVGWSGVGWSGVGWSGVGWSGVGWSGVGWS